MRFSTPPDFEEERDLESAFVSAGVHVDPNAEAQVDNGEEEEVNVKQKHSGIGGPSDLRSCKESK